MDEVTMNPMDLDVVFARFLHREVANGDASANTLRGYQAQVRQWGDWCHLHGIAPAHATNSDVIDYRQHLNQTLHYKTSTIACKLTIIRQFYAAAVSHGIHPDNSAAVVRFSRAKRTQDDFRYLSEVDYTLLLRAIDKGNAAKNLRDKTTMAMMGLQGLSTVEIERANADDLDATGESTSLLVRGKNHDRVIYLRPDVQ